MSLFKGSYLRVMSPRTTDGRTPMMGTDDRVVLKEDFLPLSAKRDLEIQNKDLPDILKKKIEVISSKVIGDDTQPIIKEKGTTIKK